MDTREVAAEYRLGQWEQVITDRREKGVTIRAYCQELGIQESTYHYWQRRLREVYAAKAEAVKESKGWLAVQAAPDTNANAELSIEVNGFRIGVGMETDEALLTKVCRVLKGL